MKERFQRAIKAAEEILYDRFGVQAADHIRLEDMVEYLGVEVIRCDLSDCAALLTFAGGAAKIRVPNRGSSAERERFSIAHELGHFLIHARLRSCSDRDLENWQSDVDLEREANAFAAELLLPRRLVAKRCDVREVSFEPVKAMAAEFTTSKTATAVRFVHLCPEPCALVMSEKGVIRWSIRNDGFWPYLPSRHERLAPESLTATALRKGATPAEPMDVPASCWTDDRRVDGEAEVQEDVLLHAPSGRALSLIWLPGWPDGDEADDA